MKHPTSKKENRMRLSYDLPYLVIQWSMAGILFCSAIISVLEMQRISIWTILFFGLFLLVLLVPRRSFLYFLDDRLTFSYIFGLEKKDVQWDTFQHVHIMDGRQLELRDTNMSSMHQFYLPKKRVPLFLENLKQRKPSVTITYYDSIKEIS